MSLGISIGKVAHENVLTHGEAWHHFIRRLPHAGAGAGLCGLARRLTGAVAFGHCGGAPREDTD
jgi:hypothetical protein